MELGGSQPGGEVITKLHVSIESLRNAYNHLHSHLNTFVCSSLCFVDAAHDRSEVYQFWIDLGVESGVAELLAELNLQWEPSSGQLQVHASQASREELTEAISGVILTLLRLKKLTGSRWTTVGDSCRSLVAALHVGLGGLVVTARKDPETSDYHLHGIVQLDASARRYATIAAMCARVPDAALLELSQDDHVAEEAKAHGQHARGPGCRRSGAQAVSRHVNRRSVDGATVRAIQEHFPMMTQLYMTQHKVNGLTIIDYVLQAKTECKGIKGKKLGSAFWMGVRNLYADADLVTPDLQVKDMGQVASETFAEALDQARTANCAKRSQAAFISWLQAAEAVNQKEFVGIARHALTLKVNSNQAQPRALNQYHTQSYPIK